MFEYYISNLSGFAQASSKFYLSPTEHPIRKTTKKPWGLYQ